MKKSIKKSLVLVSAAAMAVPAIGINASAEQVGYRNISGSDRFSTAVSISKSGWPAGSENVILVNSDAVADSLSVAPLASRMKAPVLLTKSGFLNSETKNEILRLGAKNITIIGGEGSVSSNIESQLTSSGYNTERISGSTRVETSLKIAEKLKSVSDEGFKNIFIVNGMAGLADAAGVGSVAAKNNSPIIFVNRNGADMAKSEVGSMNPEKVYLIGGKSSLPESFEGIASNIERISGKDRQETNYNMINKFYPGYSTVYIADDGSKNPTKLIDSVLINAGIIASNNTSSYTGGIQTVQNTEKPAALQNGSESKENVSTEKKADVEENSAKSAKVSEESVETVTQSSSAKKDANTSSVGLMEGPVMLVGENKGLTYSQMKALNNDSNPVKNIVQVSGGNRFTSQINNIKGFIENRDNENVKKAFDKIMGYEYVVIEYNVGGKKTVLDGTGILKMIVSNPSNGYALDFNKDMIRNFVSGINVSAVSPSGDAFAYRQNGNVVINRNGAKAKIDVNSESAKLLEMLKSGKTYRGIVPKYTKSEVPKGASPLGNTYVQISLRNQNMKVWKNGKNVINTPIVSGNPNRGSATPPGIFKIKNKMRNVVLRGPGYASPVKYWIPFNGSIGIHDSYWQPVYGGRRYLSHGSHGCINTPLNAVGNLYNHVKIGTPVIVQ